jgi:hypothetical protein
MAVEDNFANRSTHPRALLLCLTNAHPYGFSQVFASAGVFNRQPTLTIWLAFRTLADFFPHLNLHPNLLAAIALAAMLAGLIFLWQRNPSSRNSLGWIFVLCLLATLATKSRGFYLVSCLVCWLWLFAVPKSRKLSLASDYCRLPHLPDPDPPACGGGGFPSEMGRRSLVGTRFQQRPILALCGHSRPVRENHPREQAVSAAIDVG